MPTIELATDLSYAAEKVFVDPKVGYLAFASGLCSCSQPNGATNLRDGFSGHPGSNNDGDNSYQVKIKIDTKLQSVTWAVARVALAGMSDNSWADNVAWRIDEPYIVDISGGVVSVLVNVDIHDSDGYLDRLAVSVQAVGDGNPCG